MTFKNLMNNSTSQLMFMLSKSSTSKYIIMVRNVIDDVRLNLINHLVGFIPCQICLYFSN